MVPEDTDIVWCIDSDELFHSKDIEAVIRFWEQHYQPASIGFLSNTL